jgi:ABC-type phosphate transport system permease subunit
VAIALPLGLACAVYVAELAPLRIRTGLKSAVEVLAGIPSVVIGFIGLSVVAPWLKEELHLISGLTALAGSLMLAFMALPTVISISEDALVAVPGDYKQASLALGGTQLQTIWQSTIPAARSGLVAAAMLGVGRAIGETMTVMMVTGNAAVRDGERPMCRPGGGDPDVSLLPRGHGRLSAELSGAAIGGSGIDGGHLCSRSLSAGLTLRAAACREPPCGLSPKRHQA